MRKNDLIKLLESVPGNPDIRINFPQNAGADEDAIWAVTGDEHQIDLWAAPLDALLIAFGQDRDDYTILFEKS
jgi:hypothetical protein